MTVAELIQKLSAMPQDALVLVQDPGWIEEGYLQDADPEIGNAGKGRHGRLGIPLYWRDDKDGTIPAVFL